MYYYHRIYYCRHTRKSVVEDRKEPSVRVSIRHRHHIAKWYSTRLSSLAALTQRRSGFHLIQLVHGEKYGTKQEDGLVLSVEVRVLGLCPQYGAPVLD